MRGRSRAGQGVGALLTAALLLAGCAMGGQERDSGRTVKIGVIAPISGEISAIGIGIRNSVELAVKQANDANRIPGWRIAVSAEDDTANPNVGAQVAAKLASDQQVAAVVGTYNSSVAQQVQPILDRAGIVMISPGNTNPTLTQGGNPASKRRPYRTYFRVATTDAIQGPFAANYAFQDLGARTAVVIHDKKTYGQGLAQAFADQFQRSGGRVLSTETINPGDKDFAAVLSKVRGLNPAMIFYGGEYPEASLISVQAKQQGIRVPLMGGDGIYDKSYIQTAGNAAEGDLATSIGAPTDKLPKAAQFVSSYRQAGYRDDFAAYGPYAFDAANVIIEALARILPGKSELTPQTREELLLNVQRTSLDGVTGRVAFDEFGDTTTKVLTAYRVTRGAWEPVRTSEF